MNNLSFLFSFINTKCMLVKHNDSQYVHFSCLGGRKKEEKKNHNLPAHFFSRHITVNTTFSFGLIEILRNKLVLCLPTNKLYYILGANVGLLLYGDVFVMRIIALSSSLLLCSLPATFVVPVV